MKSQGGKRRSRPLDEIGELGLIEAIKRRFICTDDSLLIGIGDDAALVRSSTDRILITTDTMTEGIHFLEELFTPYQIGYKLVISNVSDIYAMNGTPRWGVLSLSLPSGWGMEEFESIVEGISDAASAYGVCVVGGDLTASRTGVTVSMTLLGTAEKVVRRSTANIKDRLYLTGPVGEAFLGFQILKRINRAVRLEQQERIDMEIQWSVVEPLLRRFLLPELVNPESLDINKTAMIDVSDGLFIDLYRLCRDSMVGVRIYEELLPVTEQMTLAAEFFGVDLKKAIFRGGEDYQYLITTAEKVDMEGLYLIGEITDNDMVLVKKDGSVEPIYPEGYQHFVSNQ